MGENDDNEIMHNNITSPIFEELPKLTILNSNKKDEKLEAIRQ